MLDQKHNELIINFLSLLNDEEKLMYQQVTDYLLELGYIPKKQKVQGYVLSFCHRKTKKIIAKMGIRSNKEKSSYFSMKYFACKSFSDKFHDAIKQEIESRNGQYCTQLSTDAKAERSSEKNRCGYCNSCTGGGLSYYYEYPDGKAYLRCGAYPITIPNLTNNDLNEVKSLLHEQHNYFMIIA